MSSPNLFDFFNDAAVGFVREVFAISQITQLLMNLVSITQKVLEANTNLEASFALIFESSLITPEQKVALSQAISANSAAAESIKAALTGQPVSPPPDVVSIDSSVLVDSDQSIPDLILRLNTSTAFLVESLGILQTSELLTEDVKQQLQDAVISNAAIAYNIYQFLVPSEL